MNALKFKSLFATIVTTVVCIGVLEIVGVQHLAARIAYTLLLIPSTALFFYELVKYVINIFDGNEANDSDITLYVFLDIIFSYLFVIALLMMLTWVWAEDTFFTVFGDWNTTSPLEAWIQHFYNAVMLATGLSYVVHLPKPDFIWSFVVLIFACLLSNAIWALVIQFAISIVMLTNTKKSSQQQQTTSKQHPFILSPCNIHSE